MGTAAVFIDGGYLDKVMYHCFANARIDYAGLGSALAEPDDLLRTYYYHCLPYKGSPPTQDERERYASKHRFVTALKFLPRFEVRLGRLVKRGHEANGEPIFIQKRVDLMVGVDMALLAGKGKITNVSLLSGDSDLIPAVKAVKNEGVLVTLWHGDLSSRDCVPSRELYEICDERKCISTNLIDHLIRS